jgi:hypothetical protein
MIKGGLGSKTVRPDSACFPSTHTHRVMTHSAISVILLFIVGLLQYSVVAAPVASAPASTSAPALSPALLASLQSVGALSLTEQQKVVIAAFVALNCTYPDPEEAKRFAFVRERCECLVMNLPGERGSVCVLIARLTLFDFSSRAILFIFYLAGLVTYHLTEPSSKWDPPIPTGHWVLPKRRHPERSSWRTTGCLCCFIPTKLVYPRQKKVCASCNCFDEFVYARALRVTTRRQPPG